MFFSSKPKTKFVLEWHFDDEMLSKVEIVDNYDKIYSLKHLMLKIGYSNLEINNYLKYSNPFNVVRKDLKSVKKLDPNYYDIHGDNIERSLNFIKTILIEDEEGNDINIVFPLLISAMAEYMCSFISFRNGKIHDQERYTYMVKAISEGNDFFLDDILICLNIIMKRCQTIEKFEQFYVENKNLGCYNSFYKSLVKCIGSSYLDGLLYKTFEFSLKNFKKYSSNKLFYKKDIEDISGVDIYGITFKENIDCNRLFKENIELFIEDIKIVQTMITEAYKLYETQCFNIVVPEKLLKEVDNYSIKLQLLTPGGKKKKYPLIIEFNATVGKITYIFVYSYKQTGELDRIDITIIYDNKERIIICKNENEIFTIFEIKECKNMINSFPSVVYKK